MSSLSRVEILLQQHKYDLAEKDVKLYLGENPNSGIAHSYLALVYNGLNKHEEALDAAKKGVGLMPTEAYTLYVLSKCYLAVDNLPEAEKAQREGLQLDPEDEDYLINLAAIQNDQNKLEDALITIDRALEQNPESANAKKIKSVILRSMGRYTDADKLASESLKDNPEDASAFAAKGWTALDTGKPKESLEYFKGAVMLDPTSQYAKSGMVMALKAQNKLFNLFYQYYNWVSQLSSKARWGLMVGLILLVNISKRVQESNEDLAPFLGVFIAVYLAFVFLTWTINSIFNIFLRFNKYGKHALSRGEIVGSNVMAILLGSAIIQYALHLLVPSYPITGAMGALFLTLPVATTFVYWGSKAFQKNVLYCFALGTLWLISVGGEVLNIHQLVGITWIAFLAGVVGYTWYIGLRSK